MLLSKISGVAVWIFISYVLGVKYQIAV